MRSKQQYDAIKQKRYARIGKPPRMRNPSRNTVKKIMRRAWKAMLDWENGPGPFKSGDEKNYFLFNWVGARLYIMSKDKICNREPKGCERYKPNQCSPHKTMNPVLSAPPPGSRPGTF